MGGKRTKRKRVATGIYSDKFGFGIPIRGKEHRFPLGTPTEELIRNRKELLDEAGPVPSRRGTLGAIIDAYLLTLPEGRTRNEAAAMLRHWTDALGTRASGDIKPIEIRQQLAAWLTKGPNGRPFTKKHLNNMLHVLRAVYRASYGRTLNPAEEVDVYTVKYTDARALPYPMIAYILQGMPDRGQPTGAGKGSLPTVNKAKLRLTVMAYTGLAQAMVKRIEAKHIDLRKKEVFVQMRLKGKGVIGATLPLLDDGVAAFRALMKGQALGHFSSQTLAQCWRRAVNRSKLQWDEEQAKKRSPKPWPIAADARAYDLRHSFGTAALVLTGDLEATANLLRHSNINTTRRYAQAASAIRAKIAIKTMNRAKLP